MFNIDRRYLLAASIVILVIVFTAGIKYGGIKQPSAVGEIITPAVKTVGNNPTASEALQIYVCGEVEKPGLYKLKAGARVYDALKMAGILPGAALDFAQPARKLQDGETIELLAETQIKDLNMNNKVGMLPASSALTSSSKPSSSNGLLNINTASVQELDDRLPGIGPTLAQRIIDYRNSNGGFGSVEDINNVSGIGDKKFADIKDLISVR
ncbi:MAG TPA: ComEA family DNA-binding protein [Syntrophomonas sp.]|nr:ComEA family DNA-binding protein [Syntrophomonas sp.]